MAPKEVGAARRRLVGLLGVPTYDSDEDEDWKPDAQAYDEDVKPVLQAKKRGAKPASSVDEQLDVPLRRRRKTQRQQSDGGGADQGAQADAKRPRRSARSQPDSSQQPAQPKKQPQREGRARGGAAAAAAAGRSCDGAAARSAAAAAGSEAVAAAAPRDWGGLTAPLLVEVLRRACAPSALPTAGTAPCVCRHWRDVCRDLEAVAKGAAAAAASVTAAREVAEATAAAARAPRALTGGDSASAADGTDISAAAPGSATAVDDSGQGGAAAADLVDADQGGLWGCMDIRGRPNVRFDDRVVQAGLASGRWSQLHTLRLRSCPGLSSDGLAALCRGCPELTCLELSQCDSLVKPDALRASLAALPRLRLMDLSHCTGGVDAVIKWALAPRHLLAQQQQQQAADGGAAGGAREASDSGAGAGGEARTWALPCPLRVLRARGCPRLGRGTFKALAPDVPYVTLAPARPIGPATTTNAAVDSAVVPLFVHLTELDLTGSGTISPALSLAIEKLQAAAPNLRILRLDAVGSVVHGCLLLSKETETPGPGFPQLRVCELGLSRSNLMNGSNPNQRSGRTLDLLRRVVGRSPRLHTLDVSGALSFLDESILASLRGAEDGLGAAATAAAAAAAVGEPPAQLRDRLRQSLRHDMSRVTTVMWPLRVLRASRSLLASDAGLHALSEQLGGTLQLIDVSESNNVTDAGLLHVARNCTALTSLDVSGTAITDYGLRVLLALRCAAQPALAAADGAAAAATVAAAAGEAGPSSGGGGGGSAATTATGAASSRGRAPGSRPSVPRLIDLTSDTEDEGEGGGGAGGTGLRHLDISSCRWVDRATRHAAAEGLEALRRVLGAG